MRLSILSATVSLVALTALAACSSAPKAPAAPVQANTAAPAAQPAAQAATGDATTDTPAPRARRKYTNTGSRLPTESPDADPSIGMPASGLSNTTSNAGGGSPH